MLYLTVEDDDIGISLLTFVPQLLLLLAISKVFRIAKNKKITQNCIALSRKHPFIGPEIEFWNKVKYPGEKVHPNNKALQCLHFNFR